MRRWLTGLLASCAAVASAIAIGITPASATTFPTTSGEFTDGAEGWAVVQFTWFNRSVGVTGSIHNTDLAKNKLEQIRLQFMAGDTQVGQVQTRSTSTNAGKGFDFTQDASAIPGGITRVFVVMCSENIPDSSALACWTGSQVVTMNRP